MEPAAVLLLMLLLLVAGRFRSFSVPSLQAVHKSLQVVQRIRGSGSKKRRAMEGATGAAIG
jgi:hypothetical protein